VLLGLYGCLLRAGRTGDGHKNDARTYG